MKKQGERKGWLRQPSHWIPFSLFLIGAGCAATAIAMKSAEEKALPIAEGARQQAREEKERYFDVTESAMAKREDVVLQEQRLEAELAAAKERGAQLQNSLSELRENGNVKSFLSQREKLEGLRRENEALEDELEQKTEQYRQMLKSAYQDK